MKAMTRIAAVGLLVLSCSSKTEDGRRCPDGQSCQQDAVEFRLQASDGAAWFVVDSAQGCAPAGWLSVKDAAGSEIAIGNPTEHCCTLAECADCSFQHVVCQTGWTMPALPVSRSWDATMFPLGSLRGQSDRVRDGESVRSRRTIRRTHVRAPYGQRRDEMTCVDVPFDLPAAGPVVGTLPQ